MARQRPLSDPQWSAPIFSRLGLVCITVTALAYGVSTTMAIVATGLPALEPQVQLVGAVVSIATAALSSFIVVRTRLAPLFEVMQWTFEVGRRRWAEIGFPEGPRDLRAAIEALEARDDEPAIAARASLLAATGDTQALAALIDGWPADSPTAVAAVERHRLTLQARRGEPSDPAAAIAAANAIPDAQARIRALVLLHVDAAARDADAGRSPARELRAARRLLDGAPLEVPIPAAQNLGWIWATLLVVGCAVPVAVAAVITLGVVGVAVWVAAVGLFWLALRVQVVRARRGTEPSRAG